MLASAFDYLAHNGSLLSIKEATNLKGNIYPFTPTLCEVASVTGRSLIYYVSSQVTVIEQSLLSQGIDLNITNYQLASIANHFYTIKTEPPMSTYNMESEDTDDLVKAVYNIDSTKQLLQEITEKYVYYG